MSDKKVQKERINTIEKELKAPFGQKRVTTPISDPSEKLGQKRVVPSNSVDSGQKRVSKQPKNRKKGK